MVLQMGIKCKGTGTLKTTSAVVSHFSTLKTSKPQEFGFCLSKSEVFEINNPEQNTSLSLFLCLRWICQFLKAP